MSFILFRNANVYAPALLGLKDVLVSHGRFSEIADHIKLEASFDVDIIDVEGHILCPGFVDTLTHVGGGEGVLPHARPK